MQNGTQKMQTEQPRPENQHKPANRYKPVRQRLSYKGAWKDRFKKFIFGSKEKEGAGKQTVVYILLISIGFVYLYPLLYMISRSFMTVSDLLDSSIQWLPTSAYIDNYKNAARAMDFWKTFGEIVCSPPPLSRPQHRAVSGRTHSSTTQSKTGTPQELPAQRKESQSWQRT